MNSTLVADVGHGGHRHLYVRFLFDFLMRERPASSSPPMVYLPAETGRAVAASARGSGGRDISEPARPGGFPQRWQELAGKYSCAREFWPGMFCFWTSTGSSTG